jgi:adenylate kinase family enzyme
VELDALRHMSGWEERPDDEMRVLTTSVLDGAQQGWVVDGNYQILRDLLFDRVDTVIVLALPWRVMFWRTFKRSFKRVLRREELWNGNRESFWMTFFTRDSVVYDMWRRRDHFRNMADELEGQIPDGIETQVVRTTRALDDFYENHGLRRP